jgi:hypothetical protein
MTDAQVELAMKAHERIVILASGAQNDEAAGVVNTPPLFQTSVVDWLHDLDSNPVV